MQSSVARFVRSFFLGLTLTACAATPPIGSGIVTPRTTSIAVRVLAALTPPNPPGPAHCDYNALYTLNLKTHELSWEFCFTSQKSKRTLQPPEVATLDAALAGVKVVKRSDLCYPDAPTMSVTTSGDVTREYHADLCGGVPPLVAADATDGLVNALYKLTGN